MFLVLVSSLRSNFSSWCPLARCQANKFVLVENMKPCSLENFLNKVSESLRSPFSALFLSQPCLLLLTNKTCTFFFFCRFFLLLWIWLLFYFCWSCVYLLREYQSVHWFYSHFASPWHLLFVYYLVCFCYSSDYVITIFLRKYVKMSIALKTPDRSAKTLKNSRDLLKLTTPMLTLVFCLHKPRRLKMFVVNFLFVFE